jgi:Leucine-rich repeat (LRR) protein
MRAWVKQGKPDALLDLSSKNLTSFPPLPPNVVKVNLANNRLKDLPEMLARSFPELEHLQVSQNKLRHLPDMPSKLQTLDASDNELKDIDAYLPASLTRVGLDENKFQKIPEALRLLPRETAVELLNNPLEPEVVKETRRQMNEPSYQGPAFVLPRRGTTQRSLSPTQ